MVPAQLIHLRIFRVCLQMHKLELDNVNHLLGKPWVRGASGPECFDCWGLVKWCLNELSIPILFDVDYEFPYGIENEFKNSLGYWNEIDYPENNCLIYGYVGDTPCHIGIVIDGYVFHSIGDETDGGSVVLTKLKNFKKMYSKIGFYKWLN